ncbi:MAG: glycoside hydrolase family 127 protein, partial [Bacillota bacterium]
MPTRTFLLGIAAAMLCSLSAIAAEREQLSPVPVKAVQLQDSFWAPRIKLNHEAVIPHNIKFCETTGRIDNFSKAAGLMPGSFRGIYFDDSDVYKVLEGIAHSLAQRRDPELEKKIDEIIDKIAAAQRPDGYLYTFYTVRKELDKRWTNTKDMHEMYCAGHLIEAAVAYYQATGKRKFLDVAIKLADHIDSVFGPDKRHDVCGHEEIELALVKLYRTTNEKRYLKLAEYFINQRGNANGRTRFGDYCQDDIPLRQRTEIAGHAVRAMYFFTGAADVASLTGDSELITVMDRIWHDVVDRKMYLTGGIGPSAQNEGFTVPYDLPNDSAYAETCAAIGMVFWNYRMALMTGDAKYADVMERAMYNGAISGVSLDGQKFFYVNPLASRGKHHRQAWFDCACCPTNMARFLPNIGGYMYATTEKDLYVNLYANSTACLKDCGKFPHVDVYQHTDYPWDEGISFDFKTASLSTKFTLHLRVPGWCKNPTVSLNGKKIENPRIEKGYIVLTHGSDGYGWNAGDYLRLKLPMPVQRVYADPHVKADVGRVALQRGPLVYCLEGVDNNGWVRNLVLSKDTQLTAEFRQDLLNGVTVIKGSATPRVNGQRNPQPVQFTAVPYYAWDNREPGQMIVWLAEDPAAAEVMPAPTIAAQSKPSASHTWHLDSPEAMNDQAEPATSNDPNIPRFTWWDHKGTTEWAQYDFKTPTKVSAVEVYWFDDSPSGGCRVPKSWRLLYKDG